MKVAIFGAGVAGLSAAHELIKRNFEVEVYEAAAVPGGKARSVGVPGSGKDGRKDLPGEHGFRFFPRFYRHVIATMKEIPLPDGKGNVCDNLCQTEQIRLARFDKDSVLFPAKFPHSLKQFKKYLNKGLGADLGLSQQDKDDFAIKIWQIMTSCYERRKNEYESLSWWEFMDADSHSEAYRTILAKGLTRTLVAARAEKASTKTGGDILIQLLFDIAKPGMSSDRILNGPTNEAWINPWISHLTGKGVKFYYNSPLKKLCISNGKISSAIITGNGQEKVVSADYYLSAMPVEAMARIIDDDLIKSDPVLKNIQTLSAEVSWMNGTQFYLAKDAKISGGHTIYIDSLWALTSISQRQFWPKFKFSEYGDGNVHGILSIDISDWDTPGDLIKKPARDCTKEEIVQEIWHQLKRSLNINGKIVLDDSHLHQWYIDADIEFEIPKKNKEPLLVNTTNSWNLRPNAYSGISNLFLASDYVKTFTDLATMEGANEAARRAVNCIIDDSGSFSSKCKVWNLHEPYVLSLFRWIDARRYKKGLPWNEKFPLLFRLLQKMMILVKQIFK